MKQMKSKSFAILIITFFLCSITVMMTTILFAENKWGKSLKSDWKTGRIWGSDAYATVEYKTNYISQKNLPYNAFLFGGSKSGVMQPSILNKYTGNTFYNYWTNGGCFENYEMFLDFVLKNYTDINEVFICLSSHEVEHYKRDWKIIPAKIQRLPFPVFFGNLKLFKEKYLNIATFQALYSSRKNENLVPLTYCDGSFDSYLYQKKRDENPEQYITERVLSSWRLKDGGYERCLNDLFYVQPYLPSCNENIDALKRIKVKLDNRNIKLTVVIMPTFLSELYKYSTPQFDEYLSDVTTIVDVWNFGGINDVNMNPYNFSDGGHCFSFVTKKMIEKMYSQNSNITDNDSMDDFGILLTKDNIEQYIKSQKEKWQKLKNEYEETGAIKLEREEDESYLGN